MPAFLLTMTKGDQAEKVECLTFKQLSIDVLNLFNCRGQEGGALYKFSILKQIFIRSENVRFVQNFIFPIRKYTILKLLFFSLFPQENLKEPENTGRKEVS